MYHIVIAMSVSYVYVKYAGNLLKVQKAPYETEEKAYERAWYIAKYLLTGENATKSWIEKESLSHIWANEKYLSMKYK